MDLLRDVLAESSVGSKEVKRIATEAGITDKVLCTAREKLQVEVVREGFGPDSKTRWRLPVVPNSSVMPNPAYSPDRAQLGSEGTTGGETPPGDPSEVI